uniref:ATP synthase F0 subunit 8 n=1 Tax=Asotana magnifica TaxID=2528170 RepID=A0A4P8DND2_9CRUS|nr:ATP synthase F0 subunit 8 [Asotana magnifica]
MPQMAPMMWLFYMLMFMTILMLYLCSLFFMNSPKSTFTKSMMLPSALWQW